MKSNDVVQQITFDVLFSLEHRGQYWAAYMEPSGMMVYDENKTAVIERVGTAIDFVFSQGYGDWSDPISRIRRYLDKHGVPSVVTYVDEVVLPSKIKSERNDYRYEVTIKYKEGNDIEVKYECYVPTECFMGCY